MKVAVSVEARRRAHDQPHAGAGVAAVDHVGRLGEAARGPRPASGPRPAARPRRRRRASPRRCAARRRPPAGPRSRSTPLASRAQDQRAVRDRLVAGRDGPCPVKGPEGEALNAEWRRAQMRRRHRSGSLRGAWLLTARPCSGKGAAAFQISQRSPIGQSRTRRQTDLPELPGKFYDLGRRPAHCPKCATEFDPEEAREVPPRPRAPAGPTTRPRRRSQVKAKAERRGRGLRGRGRRRARDRRGRRRGRRPADDDEDVEPAARRTRPGRRLRRGGRRHRGGRRRAVPRDEDEEGFEEEIEGLPEEGDEEH